MPTRTAQKTAMATVMPTLPAPPPLLPAAEDDPREVALVVMLAVVMLVVLVRMWSAMDGAAVDAGPGLLASHPWASTPGPTPALAPGVPSRPIPASRSSSLVVPAAALPPPAAPVSACRVVGSAVLGAATDDCIWVPLVVLPPGAGLLGSEPPPPQTQHA